MWLILLAGFVDHYERLRRSERERVDEVRWYVQAERDEIREREKEERGKWWKGVSSDFFLSVMLTFLVHIFQPFHGSETPVNFFAGLCTDVRCVALCMSMASDVSTHERKKLWLEGAKDAKREIEN